MTKETIELLKTWTPDKMNYPCGVQQKYDGVPVKIERHGPGITGVIAWTRQGEVVSSITHIKLHAAIILQKTGSFIVGELYDATLPFKTISGQVRDTKSQHTNLVLHVFDGDLKDYKGNPTDYWWENRRRCIRDTLQSLAGLRNQDTADLPIRSIATAIANDRNQVEELYKDFMATNIDAEGMVVHDIRKVWNPGKRCWGTQRIKNVPTIDLLCVGFEEAHSIHGEPLGMVGRINCEQNYTKGGVMHTRIIGVGPGALTHSERREQWLYYKAGKFTARVLEVRYMHDETYDALRQPTFLRWRLDKEHA